MRIYEEEIKVNTKNKRKIEKFEELELLNLTNIQNILIKGQLCFDGYYVFLIKEPKYRIIMSQSIKDKVINHLVARNIVLKSFEPSLIDANVATRKDKGTAYGREILQKYIEEIKKEKKEIYYLKCDISKYFYNIDHQVLKNIMRTKIKDPKALFLLDEIISSTDDPYVYRNISKICENEKLRIRSLNISEKEKREKIRQIERIPKFSVKGKGIPIGNMTSQAFAIIYLNGFDHYVKEELHVRYYVRYMDDFIFLSTSKTELKEIWEKIEKKLLDEYKLVLNPKTHIGTLKNGLDLLGYRFILDHNKLYLKLRTDVKRRFKKKIKNLYKAYKDGKIEYEKIINVEGSYYGHLLPGNTYYLYHKVIDPYKREEITLGKKVKI